MGQSARPAKPSRWAMAPNFALHIRVLRCRGRHFGLSRATIALARPGGRPQIPWEA
jgi:hypothetical protein